MEQLFGQALSKVPGDITAGLLIEIPGAFANGIVTDIVIGGLQSFDSAPTLECRAYPDRNVPTLYKIMRIAPLDSSTDVTQWTLPSSSPFIVRAFFHDAGYAGPSPCDMFRFYIDPDPATGTWIGQVRAYDRYLKRFRPATI